ncbi:sulfotransferase [Penaeus vannamei]|uniref:Sulfotransferase n=1 Tax=Penaeus vannamei TaxID=6689 RepID=A0A3R7PVW3_PENVA|nr:sulfotransferase [Penaeus vannamei]
MQKFTYDTSVSAANFTLILQTESAMPEHQLPVTLEEIPEEEMARYPVRRTKGVKTFVRTKPGGVLMPATYAHLAKRFYNLELRSDDVVVAAYPKSGTVWTAEVVWALLNPHALDTLEAKPHHHRATLLDMELPKQSPRKLKDKQSSPAKRILSLPRRSLAGGVMSAPAGRSGSVPQDPEDTPSHQSS